MMLQSPLTSTPFSVKDILKLEQQQQQQQQISGSGLHSQQLSGSGVHLARSPRRQQQHFQSPPSCMLAAPRDSPSFSDGEDNLAYLSALTARGEEEDHGGETSLSPHMYAHPGMHGAKLEAAELEEPESSEFRQRSRPCQGTKGSRVHGWG